MSEMDNYKPGSFCWTELATNDRKKAAEFYGALFGWEANERPMGPDDVYVMLTKNGKTVGALYQDTRSGAPPHWNNYVAVESADAASEKAKSLGGRVMKEPNDIPNVGRFSVVGDPQGAMFNLFQAKM